MNRVPIGIVNQARLSQEVNNAKQKLGGDVAWVRHAIGLDTSGDPAIYFRIVLTDAASREFTLADVTERITTLLIEEIRPYENWGLIPYFSFRSESEQAKRSEPEWVA